MALGSNYLQELIEAYVLPCSLCSAKDHPLSIFHLSLAGSKLWDFATVFSLHTCCLTNFQHNQPLF